MRFAGAVAAVLAAGRIAACGGAAPAGDGSLGDGSPPPPPAVDPAAGPPALLASFDERALVLDAAGRVRRVLPRSVTASARPCPGGRLLVDAEAFGGRVEVRTVGGALRWRRRIPLAGLDALECLDPRARRVAVVLGSDRVKSLHIVSRGADRRVRRVRGTVPALSATRMYVSDRRRVRVMALPSGRDVTSVKVPSHMHEADPSADGRYVAMATLGSPDPHFLADTSTGAVRPIELPGVQLAGWIGPDRLAVRTREGLAILDSRLDVVARLAGFRPEQSVVDGEDLFAVAGGTLHAVETSTPSVRAVGELPRDTWLIASLR